MNVGAIAIDWFEPTVSADTSPDGRGYSRVTIAGTAPYPVAEELRELVENYRLRRTIGGVKGILEFVELECPSLASWDGWYVLTGFSSSTDRTRMEAAESTYPELGQGLTATVPFTLTGVRIGDQP